MCAQYVVFEQPFSDRKRYATGSAVPDEYVGCSFEL
jgi:hypothetical protein